MYVPNEHQGNDSINAPIPLTISLFLAQDMFPRRRFTPVTSLRFPLIKIRAAESHLAVVAIALLTALIAKYSAVSSSRTSYLTMLHSRGYPDMNALRLVYQHARSSVSGTERNSAQQVAVTTAFDPPDSNDAPALDTPISPKGLAFNLHLGAPLEATESPNAVLVYIYRFFEIKNLPGFLLSLLSLVIYIFLYLMFNENTN